jgi:hypothetical protein
MKWSPPGGVAILYGVATNFPQQGEKLVIGLWEGKPVDLFE